MTWLAEYPGKEIENSTRDPVSFANEIHIARCVLPGAGRTKRGRSEICNVPFASDPAKRPGVSLPECI